MIPDEYVESITERYHFTSGLKTVRTMQELEAMRTELNDRFGGVPQQVQDFYYGTLPQAGRRSWFEKMSLKDRHCGVLINRPDSLISNPVFQSIMGTCKREP